MPFLYDVCNSKLQLYANRLVWSRGESTSKKLFLFPIFVEKQKWSFQPIFLIGTCPMRKDFLQITQELNQLSVPRKNNILFETFIGPFLCAILH